jgi:hemolysin activation/secretion protein
MIPTNPGLSFLRMLSRECCSRRLAACLHPAIFCCLTAVLLISIAPAVRAQLPNNSDTPESNTTAHFDVETYEVVGGPKISMDVVFPILAKFTGTNVSGTEIAEAAFALQAEYHKEGFPMTSVAIARGQITNGVVVMNVFQAASPQIIISGVRYDSPANAAMAFTLPPSESAQAPQASAAAAAAAPAAPAPPNPVSLVAPVIAAKPISPKEMAAARDALSKETFKLDTVGPDTRIHVVSTNAGPRFDVEHYVVTGNSVLTSHTIAATITNIDGAFGTNVSFDGVKAVVEQLQQAYHDRGYSTVFVTLPHQKLTNATVKIEVLEGRLQAIDITGNRYFSSNNIMRALPSLHSNMVIDAPVLQAELNRANANQDRQIIPIVGPGSEPGTSVLTLRVKDRLPLHAKVDLDNHYSPGTPALRVNTSAVYNNLWQLEHSIGAQYSFSPEKYKPPDDWPFYDQPQVANYSAFYRLPLGNPVSLENRITANPGSFGFSEATRKFNLPPAGNTPSLTVFASRSTIDTGSANTLNSVITEPGSNPSISEQDFVHSPTINQDIAGRFDYPLTTSGNLQSSFSGGLDFKFYQITNYKTNFFTFVQTNFLNGIPVLPPDVNVVPSLVPITENEVHYLPLSFHYSGNWNDSYGVSTIGLGVGVNLWYDALFATTATATVLTTNSNGTITTNVVTSTKNVTGKKAIQLIAGSSESTGYWVVLNPSYSRTILLHDWTTSFRTDAQLASQPLISPEQFGAGGVNSVRGYPEGDVFGDEGWHMSLEEDTPVHTVGMIRDGTPLTFRASIYTDYAGVYLLDPQGRPRWQRLWGTGMGFTAGAGPHWQAQFLFSWPLISSPDTPAYQPRFDFALTAQF